MNPQTFCKGCVFAVSRNDKQTGCELYRAEKLNIVDTDTETNHYILQRYCNTYRPKEWLEELSLEDYKNRHQIALKEIVSRVGFIVFLDSTAENAIEELKITINDIVNQTLYKARYVVVVTDKTEYNEEIQSLLVDNFDHDNTLHHLVKISHVPENKGFMIDESFKHAKNGWIYVTTSGERIDQELVEKINQRVNIDMKRLSVVKPYDDFNGLLFSTPLFKMLNGNRKKAYETDEGEIEFDDRPFLEKVEDMKDNTGETLITWEEFNAS
tara:strand:+ start:427 stop:1233 length:807 start_codon:yes stop_codon:yes gene_type:complete